MAGSSSGRELFFAEANSDDDDDEAELDNDLPLDGRSLEQEEEEDEVDFEELWLMEDAGRSDEQEDDDVDATVDVVKDEFNETDVCGCSVGLDLPNDDTVCVCSEGSDGFWVVLLVIVLFLAVAAGRGRT